MQSLSIKFNDTNIELQNALHNTSAIMNLGDYTDNMQQSIYELIGPYSLSNDLLEVIGSW